jgi:hypothetical protein
MQCSCEVNAENVTTLEFIPIRQEQYLTITRLKQLAIDKEA